MNIGLISEVQQQSVKPLVLLNESYGSLFIVNGKQWEAIKAFETRGGGN